MIEIRNLVKHYGGIKAVNDISFTVEKGEILGFLARTAPQVHDHEYLDGISVGNVRHSPDR